MCFMLDSCHPLAAGLSSRSVATQACTHLHCQAPCKDTHAYHTKIHRTAHALSQHHAQCQEDHLNNMPHKDEKQTEQEAARMVGIETLLTRPDPLACI